MSTPDTIDLRCSCGASLHLVTTWSPTLIREREAFNAQHADCTKPGDPPGPDQPTPVDGTHHPVEDAPLTLGFVPPSNAPWKWSDA